MALRLITLLVLTMSLGTRAPGQAIDEYQVKAAFLFSFAKFVEWPPEVFKTPKDPILVCVLGNNPFGTSLDEVIRGKSIEGHAFAFRQVDDAAEQEQLHISSKLLSLAQIVRTEKPR